MNSLNIVGVILIVLGVFGLIYGGITYYHEKNVVDMGDVKLEVTEKESVPIPPILGAVAILLGGILMSRGKKGSGLA